MKLLRVDRAAASIARIDLDRFNCRKWLVKASYNWVSLTEGAELYGK